MTLLAAPPECLWDDALPVEVKELPEDLAALDVLLADQALLWPLVEWWRAEFEQTGRAVLSDGRPTIALESYVRLLVLNQRYRWGYRTLVAEVSYSIHLRRFCRISLTERVPDESTVRKLTRRIGPETVGDDTCIDHQGDAGEALPTTGGADRFDRDRGRCEVSEGCGVGLEPRQDAGPGGPQAGEADRREEAAGAGSLAVDGRQAAGYFPDDPPPLGEAKVKVLKLTEETGELLSARSRRHVGSRPAPDSRPAGAALARG